MAAGFELSAALDADPGATVPDPEVGQYLTNDAAFEVNWQPVRAGVYTLRADYKGVGGWALGGTPAQVCQLLLCQCFYPSIVPVSNLPLSLPVSVVPAVNVLPVSRALLLLACYTAQGFCTEALLCHM